MLLDRVILLNDDYEYSIGHHLFNLFERKENFINVGYPGADLKPYTIIVTILKNKY